MVRWRDGTVTAVRRRWRGAVELDVSLVRRRDDDPDTVRALAYPAVVGEPEPGDRVLVNLNALALGLGTGGYAMVVALPDRLPADGEPSGHEVKARYTPLQVVVDAADSEGWVSLDGTPVVTADLHSALPAVVAGVHATRPDARVAYAMTDGGALPAWFSRTLDALADRLAGVVTTGQAFGGDIEATNVHSGLLAARHVFGADVVVVTQGPGNLGTGTAWGFSGTAIGEAVNAVAALGGRAVGALRVSEADPRPRHRGVSHHSLTAYGRVALARATLVVPAGFSSGDLDQLRDRHEVVEVPVDGLDAALRALPVKLSTMGRDLDADHLYFLAAAAAGRYAAGLIA